MGLNKAAADIRAAAREVLIAARDPAMTVWALYILLVPLYVIKSGLPQPGDWLIVLLAPLSHLKRVPGAPPRIQLIKRVLLTFLIYLIFMNFIWSVALGDWAMTPRYGFMMAPLFYLYNVIMFFVVLRLYQRQKSRFLWFTAKIILTSLVMQVIVSAVHASPGLRVTVLFNNANQLGFFGVLSAAMLFLFQRRGYVSTTEVAVGLLCAVYLCLLSASKAALGAIALLSLFGMMVRMRTVIIVGLVVVASLTIDSPINRAVQRTLTRLATDQSNPTVEERGYDRIYNNPQYLITGSGEGDYERFRETTVIGGHEIHSSIGTLVFCYGVVGLTLFGIFIWLVLRGTGIRTWLLVAPSFAYGMAHQGLRFTLFWVLLAIVVAMRQEPVPARGAKPPLGRFPNRLPQKAVRPA